MEFSAMQGDDGLLDLDNQFCFALYAASRGVMRAYGEALKTLDLTYPQYLVMLVLWEWARKKNCSRPTVKALGDRLDLDSGTLTPLLRRLQEKGLITRKRVSKDEREVFVAVTPTGARLKIRARAIPLKMLEHCPITVEELLHLKTQLRLFRSAHAA
jgi:DNA-binding MarR family transcriptional regulator